MSFYEKIEKDVKQLKEKFNYKDEGTAFSHFVIKECFDKIIDFGYEGSDFDGYIHDHIVDMANDLGNDAIFTNKDDNHIRIFQFKFSENNLLNTEEIKKNKTFIDWLLHISTTPQNPNPKLRKIIDTEIKDILEKSEGKFIISFYYIDSNFGTNIKTDIISLYNNYRDKNIDFEIKFYNHKELNELYDDIEIPENNVVLGLVPNESFVKDFEYHDNGEIINLPVLVGSIRANSLKKLVEDYKELLFTLNVRYYKGENEINSKIKEEYAKGKKSNFWILNNGINAVCENFEIVNSNEIKIKNLQIVNGGQTAKTLTRVVNDIPDEIHILLRLTKISDTTKVSKISKEIARASNTQNAIDSRDLHSGDRLQTTIFKKLTEVGIFFDKKAGEWATVIKKKYKNPSGQGYIKISNKEMGTAYMSFFLQIPISSKGRDKLVFSNEYYEEIFNPNVQEDQQFTKLMFGFRLSEKIYDIKTINEAKYIILQNNFIGDVILSLSALYFLKSKITSLRPNIEDVRIKLDELEYHQYLLPEKHYALNLGDDFDKYVLHIIEKLEYMLDVKKEAKSQTGEEWIARDTNNWLKKDGTYKAILTSVLQKIK